MTTMMAIAIVIVIVVVANVNFKINLYISVNLIYATVVCVKYTYIALKE